MVDYTFNIGTLIDKAKVKLSSYVTKFTSAKKACA